MTQPRQFTLMSIAVFAVQRDGTLRKDLEIAEWMERFEPHGEYRAGPGMFRVVTPAGDLQAADDDWILRCGDQFVPCPNAVLSAITAGAAGTPGQSRCSECCDPVPPSELFLIPSGAELCQDCLLEYQLQLEAPEHAG